MSKPKGQPSEQAGFWPQPLPRAEIRLEEAKRIAGDLVAMLSPHCERIAVAGSIRRQRPVVHDLDLVLIPRDLARLQETLRSAGQSLSGGEKIKAVIFEGTCNLSCQESA